MSLSTTTRAENTFNLAFLSHPKLMEKGKKKLYMISPTASMTSTPESPAPSSTHSASSYLSYPVTHVMTGLYRRLTEPPPPPATNKPAPLDISTPPPQRTASPFQPPPLTPRSLRGVPGSMPSSAQILSAALAEEIRLLVPPRLQLAETWRLVYSLEEDGVSLATLYAKCTAPDLPKRCSFVLAVRDAAGGVSFPPPKVLTSLPPLTDKTEG